jgi:hypothetical protein
MFKQPFSLLIFTALMWLGISLLLAFLSGWFSLAKRFRNTQKLTGDNLRFVSALMGSPGWIPVNYRSCLFITITDPGFKLSVFFPFQLFHPPLFIPWQQVKSVASQSGLFSDNAVVCIQESSIKLRVIGRSGQSLIKAFENFSAR